MILLGENILGGSRSIGATLQHSETDHFVRIIEGIEPPDGGLKKMNF